MKKIIIAAILLLAFCAPVYAGFFDFCNFTNYNNFIYSGGGGGSVAPWSGSVFAFGDGSVIVFADGSVMSTQ